MKRTAISLFLDDNHFRPRGAFGQVMDFLESEGVRGKVSAMPGYGAAADDAATLGRSDKPVVQEYVAELARAGRAASMCTWN